MSDAQAKTSLFKGRKGRLEVVGIIGDVDEATVTAAAETVAALQPAPPAGVTHPAPETPPAPQPEPKPARKPRTQATPQAEPVRPPAEETTAPKRMRFR